MDPQSYRFSYKYRFIRGFLRALKRINSQKPFVSSSSSSSSSSSRETSKRYLKVKYAADASMASAVGSRRAWSRAMLRKIVRDGRYKLRGRPCNANYHNFLASRRSNVKKRSYLEANCYNKKKDVTSKEIFEAKELRKVVPGGEAMDLCNLLDETAHYIKCLATQVKLMRRIAEFYSA